MKNIQKIFKNLINKINSLSTKDKIVSSLWLFTFVMLILFVILVGSLDKTKVNMYANALAGSGLAFALILFGSLITTVIFADKKRKEGVNNG